MPKYTTEELIQFMYNETPEEKAHAIAKAVETDWDTKEKLGALKESIQQLDSVKASPRPQSILAILNYAKNTAPVEQS
jgi:hypothetical protein